MLLMRLFDLKIIGARAKNWCKFIFLSEANALLSFKRSTGFVNSADGRYLFLSKFLSRSNHIIEVVCLRTDQVTFVKAIKVTYHCTWLWCNLVLEGSIFSLYWGNLPTGRQSILFGTITKLISLTYRTEPLSKTHEAGWERKGELFAVFEHRSI